MRRAAAIVCVVVCAGCGSHGGAVSVSTPAASRHDLTASSSTPRASASHSNRSARPPIAAPPRVDNLAAVPAIADAPSTLGRQLAAAEQAVRAPGTSPSALLGAARTAQAAYRRIGLHPHWDATVLGVVPRWLRATVVANLRARRELRAITGQSEDLLPTWRIDSAAPSGELLSWYHAAASQFGVGWQYLAAVNMVETSFGKIHGSSASGAQGPMQFMPATWASYGAGGDVNNPHDAIFGAARYLADRGLARGDVDAALYAYNPTVHYRNAVKAIASVLVADPGSFVGYYRWDVYYPTSSGDLLLPPGFSASHRMSSAAYARAHPERVLR